MRAALLALLVLALGLAAVLTAVSVDPAGGVDTPVDERGRARAAVDEEPAQPAADPVPAPPVPVAVPTVDHTPFSERDPIDLADLPEDKMRAFQGFVLLRQEAGPSRAVRAGHFDLEIIRFGHRYPQRVELENGRFAVEVPIDARVKLGAGRFGGTVAHFEEPLGVFDPPAVEYALEATPTTLVTLIVRDGPTGAPLTDVRVARSAEGTSPRLEGAAEEKGRELVASAPSPVLLPHIRADGPIWLRVSAPGYAATAALVDPRETSQHELTLWPAADLDLRVQGPGRPKLRALVLAQSLSGGGFIHVGTFTGTEGEKEPDGLHFRLRGLAARRHLLTAKGFDARGRMLELGQVEVDLGAGERGTAELYLP